MVSQLNPTTKKIYHASVNACLAPLVSVDGKHVITVEGIGNVKNPHPAQERIAKGNGSQCGFCTPGIVMVRVEPPESAMSINIGVYRACMRFCATTAIPPSSRLKKHSTETFAGVQAIDRSLTQHSLSVGKVHAGRHGAMLTAAAVWRMAKENLEDVP